MPNPPDISDELDKIYNVGIDENNFVTDTYRVSPSILLMSPDGQWLSTSENIPEFKQWAEEFLFPWTKRSQVVVITTPPGKSMAPHIDCSPKAFTTIQHKFRCVIRGNIPTLRWLHKDGHTFIPDVDKPYIISGRWPHDMTNTHDKVKYTLCLGAPWEANLEDKKYHDMLIKSYNKYKDYYLSYENWNLPNNWKDLFNKEKYDTSDLPDDFHF